MKKVFIVLLAVFSLSSFAAKEKIDCKVVAEAQSGRAEFNEVFTKKNSLESVKLCYAMATEIGVAYADCRFPLDGHHLNSTLGHHHG